MTKKGQSKVLIKLKLFSEKTLLMKLRARKERAGGKGDGRTNQENQ